MIDSEQVQDRRVQIMHIVGILEDVVRVVVRLADRLAGLDASAGEENREAPRVMVAAVVGFGQRALRVDRAAELSAPDD